MFFSVLNGVGRFLAVAFGSWYISITPIRFFSSSLNKLNLAVAFETTSPICDRLDISASTTFLSPAKNVPAGTRKNPDIAPLASEVRAVP